MLLHALLLLLLSLLAATSSATPSQYCLFGAPRDEVDFCVALSLYHNHSTSAHDVYLSLSVRRPVVQPGNSSSSSSSSSSSLGWTAVGAGPRMAGSLMFVLYGDPEASAGEKIKPPTLSVRTVKTGHARPVLITQEDAAAAAGSSSQPVDVRVAETSWAKETDGDGDGSSVYFVASAHAVCYGCSDWRGTDISPESASQPWIWAWNRNQDMEAFAADEQLEMHSLVDGNYGYFYVDMEAATSHHADGFPALNLTNKDAANANANIGASDRPMAGDSNNKSLWQKLLSRPLAHLHGFFMMASFLLLFPLGAVAIRSGSTSAFKHHWAVQATASASALSGAVTAVIMSDRVFASPHQIAGVAIVCLLPLQALLGWRHHVDFLRIFRRTWISYAHIALGFTILLSGWANVLAGLALYGLGKLGIALVALVVLLEAGGVGAVSWLAARRRAATGGNRVHKETPESSAAYFALEDIPESDEEDEGAEERGLMRKGGE
ncbi:iron reductase domain protein [Trichoderma citrinoviride]|uniref:Iron reductase domain protein n=1 Tax=Trichoderma citrinoviride TaxID=58853 RepID=A0A2T4BNY9_9HYPO|nr:iron reductase domain protein [Trichoderma citrinoviride]PTB70969.1 iron reductase domain protein [Trichoderma citrinoviride]